MPEQPDLNPLRIALVLAGSVGGIGRHVASVAPRLVARGHVVTVYAPDVTAVAQGFAGVWHDMNEPVSFAAFGEPTLPRSARHALEGTGGDHRQAHNVYGLAMAAAAPPASRPTSSRVVAAESGSRPESRWTSATPPGSR